jgi:hypothetical protein
MLPDAGVPRHIDPGVPRERFMTGAGRGINRGGPTVECRMPSRQMQQKIATLLALRAAWL